MRAAGDQAFLCCRRAIDSRLRLFYLRRLPASLGYSDLSMERALQASWLSSYACEFRRRRVDAVCGHRLRQSLRPENRGRLGTRRRLRSIHP
jgi:hypothetical protein